MQAKIVRSASLLALLVLVLSVTGAFADSVTSRTAVARRSVHTLSVNNVMQNAYWIPTSLATLFPMLLPGTPIIAITSTPPPPTTPTPEPSTAYLFMLGAGLLLVGMRRRAAQS